MAEGGLTTFNPVLGIKGDENLLVDHIRRIEHNRLGCAAVHIHLSRLRPYHRQAAHVRIAIRSFDYLSNNYEASLYVLANCDLVLVCRDVRVADLDAAVAKLRSLFAEDPLIFGDEVSAGDRFSSWYDLEKDYETFLILLDDLVTEGRQITAKGEAAGPMAELGKPMDPTMLAAVSERLRRTRIADLIRQQAAIIVSGGGGGRILFREHYMSIADLKQRVAPGVHLLSDFWLFQYLTETLDQRMIAVLSRRDFESMRRPLSMNLNITSVLSPEFRTFAHQLGRHTEKVVVELQNVDVFSDLDGYAYARDWLRDKGFKVLVDSVNPMSMQFFNPRMLEADYLKVNWSAELRTAVHTDRLETLRAHMAEVRDQIVLARVDSEDAIKLGVSLGLSRFQGRFIDKLVTAMAAKARADQATRPSREDG